MKILEFIEGFFSNISQGEMEKYLSGSADLVELEHRQRLAERGEAPFQKFGGLRSRSIF